MASPAAALGPANAAPLVSAVVVVRNEERYIAGCLAGLLAQDYPRDSLEIIVVDGLSDDRTLELVSAFDTQGNSLQVVSNPGRGRAQGLNAGIRAARGEVIARVDARTRLTSDYLTRCVRTLQDTGADNVGGVQRALTDSPMQEAIGLAMSHPFGVGDAQFRLGRRAGFVDTLYLGCFRRDAFERVGLFDEEAPIISEDSELNYRIRKAGGKVYLNTDIVAYYHPREGLLDLWRLYFRYGGARAGVLLKHRALTSWRQAVAPLFVLALVGLGAGASLHPRLDRPLRVLTGTYLAANLAVSAALALRAGKPRLFGRLLLAFPCMHFAWALGFWRRLLQRSKPGSYWGY